MNKPIIEGKAFVGKELNSHQVVIDNQFQEHTVIYAYLENGEYRLVINPKTTVTEDIECEVVDPSTNLIEQNGTES